MQTWPASHSEFNVQAPEKRIISENLRSTCNTNNNIINNNNKYFHYNYNPLYNIDIDNNTQIRIGNI